MKATVCINGRKIGSVEYDLPRDEAGKVIALPKPGSTDDVSVLIEGPEHKWFGLSDLLDVTE